MEYYMESSSEYAERFVWKTSTRSVREEQFTASFSISSRLRLNSLRTLIVYSALTLYNMFNVQCREGRKRAKSAAHALYLVL